MSDTYKGKLILALSIAAAVFISHGFSIFALAVCLYAAGTSLLRGQQSLTLITIFLGGLSLLSFSSTLGSVLLTAGAALAVAFSVSAVSRSLFCLSAAAVLLSGAIEGTAPFIAAAITAALVKKEKWRALILAGGLSGVILFSGLPSAPGYNSSVSEEALTENGVMWPQPSELNLAKPRLLLQAPGIDIREMTLRISAGGVRDTCQVGHVISAGRTFPVYPGENILLIQEPEFPVSILISRKWKPFTHPVIHFVSAEASF